MENDKIAELLKSKRESLKLTIPQVAEQTKIKRSYIESMESGDFSNFDSAAYIRNFVRTYSRYLKIPESQILALLSGELTAPDPLKAPDGGMEKEPAGRVMENSGGGTEPKKILSVALLALSILILIAGCLFLFKFRSGNSVRPSIPVDGASASRSDRPALDDLMSQPPDTTIVSPVDTTPVATPSKTQPSDHRAELEAASEVWLFIETEYGRLEKVLFTGDKQVVKFSKNLRLRIGNPLGVKLTIDGKNIEMETGKKIYDRIFTAREDGKVTAESATSVSLKRFQSKDRSEGTPSQ